MMVEERGPAVEPSAFAELEQSVGDDREFLRELVETFIDDGPRQVDGMRAGLGGGEGDLEGLHRAAHTLKSNGASMGATTLSAMCRELEALSAPGRADDADTANLGERVAVIEAELERVIAELDALVPVEAS